MNYINLKIRVYSIKEPYAYSKNKLLINVIYIKHRITIINYSKTVPNGKKLINKEYTEYYGKQ